jgi:alpha-galactosidase
MLGGAATLALKDESQEIRQQGGRTHVLTTLASERGFHCLHALSFAAGQEAVEINTTFRNDSPAPLTLAMLTSFHLGRMTPFASDDAPRRLRVHRFRSVWSAEGRLDSQDIEQLHLERSWIGHGSYSERFGQVGTMPVRGFFPFVALEDKAAGVIWGAQLAWAGSWQMEVHRRDDFVNLAGGLADRELGHWTRRIAPGESFAAPPAALACVAGTLEDLTDRLTRLQEPAADAQPRVEHDLPIVFNEWCTTWGAPTHAKLMAIADRLQGSQTRYVVIDAGWYRRNSQPWGNSHGDWLPNPESFPEGLETTAAGIRKRGLIPGLWFEMENVGNASTVFGITYHLLKRVCVPFTVAERRFWDLTDPWVVDYLS